MSSAVALGGTETKSIAAFWRSIAMTWWAAGRELVTCSSPAWETPLCHIRPSGAGSCGNRAATPLSIPAMWWVHSKGMQSLQKNIFSASRNKERLALLPFASPARQWGAGSTVSAETCSVQLSLALCCAPSAAIAKGRVLQEAEFACSTILKAPPVPFLTHSQSTGGVTMQRIKAEWMEGPAGPSVSNTPCSAEVVLFVHIISSVPVRWNLRLLIQLIFLANCWPIAVYSGFFLSW